MVRRAAGYGCALPVKRVVYAFDVASDGTLSGKRTFSAIPGTGYPDGMAVDAQGDVWIALFGGARIERYSPAGALVDQIAFPCSNAGLSEAGQSENDAEHR
ncbi:MAG: hypothetical protein EPN70_06585 [Paraburkholderia sp.]|nr:MAG: hypothetical protein EPN70_06585 [Paraburkholderia sp.]